MASDREYERALAAAEGEVHVDIAPGADGDLVATVNWGDWISDGITRHGDSEGPMSVAQALRRAQEVADLYGFEKVAVAIPSDDLWDQEWGVLKSRQGPQVLEDEDDLDVADDGDEGPSPTTGWTDDDQRGGKRL